LFDRIYNPLRVDNVTTNMTKRPTVKKGVISRVSGHYIEVFDKNKYAKNETTIK
jgi:hypothetical protein